MLICSRDCLLISLTPPKSILFAKTSKKKHRSIRIGSNRKKIDNRKKIESNGISLNID